MAPAVSVDWDELRRAATEVAKRAYAPYSGLRVGAAGLVVGGSADGSAGGAAGGAAGGFAGGATGGAAGGAAGGSIVTGCNVENASYGLTLCAECGLVSALAAAGGGRLVAVATVGIGAGSPDDQTGGGTEYTTGSGAGFQDDTAGASAGDAVAAPLAPCGRCRQLLLEHGGPDLLVDAGPGAPPTRIADLLPGAFDAAALPSRRSPS